MGWLVDDVETFLGPGDRREGILETGVPGLSLFQSATASTCRHVVYKPVVCAVIRGAKRVRLGNSFHECAEGQILAVGFDAVLEATILRGSPDLPYRAISLELDFALLQEVASRMPNLPRPDEGSMDSVFVAARDTALSDTLERLLRLARTPGAIPVLAPGLLREAAYHLLSGPRSRDFLRLSLPGSHTRLLSGAVGAIQRDLSRPLRVPELAASVGMSPSSFHQRFKELTSYTPIQYQKRLRLLEARRLMLSEGTHAGDAAYRVGYRSPSQFSREYVRLFGAPPRREAVGALSASSPGRAKTISV